MITYPMSRDRQAGRAAVVIFGHTLAAIIGGMTTGCGRHSLGSRQGGQSGPRDGMSEGVGESQAGFNDGGVDGPVWGDGRQPISGEGGAGSTDVVLQAADGPRGTEDGRAFGNEVGVPRADRAPLGVARLEILPGHVTILVGEQRSLIAFVTYEDGTSADVSDLCTWGSWKPEVATVASGGGAPGQVTGRTLGWTQIEASCLGKSATAVEVRVEIRKPVQLQVVPLMTMAAVGEVVQYRGIITYSDGTTAQSEPNTRWMSSNPTVALVYTGIGGRNDPPPGQVITLAVGTTEIKAYVMGLSGSATLMVAATALKEIQVSPLARRLPSGLAQGFVATALFSDFTSRDVTESVAWLSIDPSIAVVSNDLASKGRVTARSVGRVDVQARISGIMGRSVVEVLKETVSQVRLDPATIASPVEVRTPLRATAVLSNGAPYDLGTAGIWTSSEPSVVTIDMVGEQVIVRPLAAGSASLTLNAGGVTVILPCQISPVRLEKVEIVPPQASIQGGETLAFRAVALYADGSRFDVTDQTQWQSAGPGLVSVSNAWATRGVVATVAMHVSVKASVSGSFAGQKGTADITVLGQ